MKRPCVYIMASQAQRNAVCRGDLRRLATRIRTSNRRDRRLLKRYDCKLLVWFEPYDRMGEAIAREKQIKAGSRAKKLALIEASNPDWADLYDEPEHIERSCLQDGVTLSRHCERQRSNPD